MSISQGFICHGSLKSNMGVTPQQFYTQGKVKKVRQELLREQSPALIAYGLGFKDQSRLCRTFKKYVGVFPSNLGITLPISNSTPA